MTGVGGDPPVRAGMSVDDLRKAVGPGGSLEFTHAAGVLEVPAAPVAFEARVAGLIYNACLYSRASLLRATNGDGVVREGVLISRARYDELVAVEAAAGLGMV